MWSLRWWWNAEAEAELMALAPWRNRIVGTGDEDPTQLLANPRNWRTHPKEQREALRGALSEVGWVQQVLVNQQTGHVVDGHARVEEAITRGEATVPVLYVDLTPDEEGVVLASLDPIGAMAARDDERLTALLAELHVDDAGLQALLDEIAPLKPTVGLTDPDDVPDLQEESNVKLGDLFALGDHRLMCGDSTKAEDVARLMDGEKADLVFTDPPYGVGYDGGTKVRDRLVGDDTPGLYGAALPLIAVADRASLYLCFSMRHAPVVYEATTLNGWAIRNVIIWNKNQAQFGALSAHYHDKYEPIIYATKGNPMVWNGPTNEVTVWDVDRSRTNEYHPTQKPVALVERAIANSSSSRDIVADPFSGSGSTVIASEQTNRRCYAMEIDPRYVAVSIKRWEDFTGKTSERLS